MGHQASFLGKTRDQPIKIDDICVYKALLTALYVEMCVGAADTSSRC